MASTTGTRRDISGGGGVIHGAQSAWKRALVRVRCYLHDDTHAAQGWYPNAERVLELSKPFYRS